MEFLSTVLPYLQIIISILIIAAVLLQKSASGLGALGGGADDSIKTTRRGADKFLLQATIVLGVLFGLSALLALFI